MTTTSQELPKNIYAVSYKVKGSKRAITKTKYQYKRMFKGVKISRLFDTVEEAEEWGSHLPATKEDIEAYLEQLQPTIVAKQENKLNEENQRLMSDKDKSKLKHLLKEHLEERYIKVYSGGYSSFKIKMLGIKLTEKQIYNIQSMTSRYKQIINTQFINVKTGRIRLFGDFDIEEVNIQTIREFIATRQTLGQGAAPINVSKHRKSTKNSPATIVKYISFLQIFYKLLATGNYGGSRYIGIFNPVENIDKAPIRHKYIPKDKRLLTNDEEERLIVALKEYSNPEALDIYLIAMETGCRRNEIVFLNAGDIDLNKKRIKLPITKNGFPRSIPIMSPILETIILKLVNAPHGENGRLFSYSMAGFSAAFKKILKRCEIEEFSFSHSRNAYITHFVEAGVDPLYISSIMALRDTKKLINNYIVKIREDLEQRNVLTTHKDINVARSYMRDNFMLPK